MEISDLPGLYKNALKKRTNLSLDKQVDLLNSLIDKRLEELISEGRAEVLGKDVSHKQFMEYLARIIRGDAPQDKDPIYHYLSEEHHRLNSILSDNNLRSALTDITERNPGIIFPEDDLDYHIRYG